MLLSQHGKCDAACLWCLATSCTHWLEHAARACKALSGCDGPEQGLAALPGWLGWRDKHGSSLGMVPLGPSQAPTALETSGGLQTLGPSCPASSVLPSWREKHGAAHGCHLPAPKGGGEAWYLFCLDTH